MSLEMLLAQFDGLIQTPADVAKLNGAILQWAIQGHLVPQKPIDESVTQLLADAERERQRLVKEQIIRKRKPIQSLKDIDPPFDIPKGWVFCRLGQCLELINGRAYSQNELLDAGTPVIRIQNLNGGESWYYSDLELSEDKYCDNGDLLFAWSGTFGPYIWNGERAIYHYHIWKIMLTPAIDKRFAYYLLQFLVEQAKSQSHGLMLLHITKSNMENLPVVIPPLAEQKRIVARVDALLGQTAVLAQQLSAIEEERRGVNTAVLHQLTQAADSAQTAVAFSLLQRNFDRLYVDGALIDELKQAILQTAVQGRLVPQDPNDEPASVLLERIKEEKKQLGVKNNNLPKVGKQPYSVPSCWKWVRFIDIANIASNLTQPHLYPFFPHIAPNNIEKGTGKLLEYKTVLEDDVKSAKNHFFPGQIIYSKIRPNLSKAVIVDFEGLCSADMYPLDSFINTHYLLLYILSESFLSFATKTDTRVAMPKINQAALSKIPIAVPPIEEQKRIVAKVDELFALCDQLAGQVLAAEASREQLLDALLAQAG
ncbi:MAG: restriction endonuclease subunit S [Anaerolineales bacterium]|nr:restriction endonuclease subunit S [Anaerolineales bacterium]